MFSRANLRRITTIGGSVICVLFFCHAASAQPSWSIKTSGNSAQLIDEIVKAGKLEALSFGPTSLEPPDGPMPEIAHQEIILKSGDSSAITAVKNGCAELGLSPPGKEGVDAEADLVCVGRRNGESISVYAQLSCTDSCRLAIEARTIGF
jgi:hypothetical protein